MHYKRLKSSFFLIFVFLFGLFACEPGDKPEPPAEKLTGWTQYIKIERFGSNLPVDQKPLSLDTIYTELEYDANARIALMKEKYGVTGYGRSQTELFYNGNLLESWATTTFSGGTRVNRFNLQYQGIRPVRLLTSLNGAPATSFDSLDYDPQGRLIYYHRHLSGSFVTVNAYKLTWADDNVASVEMLYGDDRDFDPATGKIALRHWRTYSYTYANTPNVRLPMLGNSEGEKLLFAGHAWHLLSKQRPVKRESLSSDRLTGETVEYRFRTNADNRLLEMETIETDLINGAVDVKWQRRTVYQFSAK